MTIDLVLFVSLISVISILCFLIYLTIIKGFFLPRDIMPGGGIENFHFFRKKFLCFFWLG